jgi:hypothetical protein
MLRLARNVVLARLAYGYISRRVAESRRSQKRARILKVAVFGVSAGAIYVAREPLLAALRGWVEGLRGEEEGLTALDYAEPPAPSPKKERKQARRNAAARATREETSGQGDVHVERNADEDLAVPMHEALKGIDAK